MRRPLHGETMRGEQPQTITVRAVIALAILLIGIVSSAASAQPGKIKFDRLSIDEGLSQATGNAIRQDAQGFIWIGTQDGLNRWDGYEFEVFKRDPDNEDSLADNFVARFNEDSRGRFWLLHQTMGAITVLDPARRSFRRVKHDLTGPHCSSTTAAFFGFRGFFEHDDGEVWFASNGGGILRVDPDTLQSEHLCHDLEDPESLGGDEVHALLKTVDGTLWIAGDGFLQRRLPPVDGRERFATFRHDPEDPRSLPPGEFFNLVEEVSDPNGTEYQLWLGGNQGLARFTPEDGTFIRFLEGDDYPQLTADDTGGDPFAVPVFFDRRGELWIAVRSGLTLYNPETGRFRHHRPDVAGSLSSRAVQAFREDQAGDVWVGTGGGGVARYLPEQDSFEIFRHDASDPHSLVNDVVMNIYESRSGTLWIGTFGGGVSTYSRSKHKFVHVALEPSGLADDTIFSILVDSEDSLWVGTQVGGLHRYSKDRQRVVERYFLDPGGPRNLGSDFIPILHEDRAGRFWAGSGGGGLALIDRDRGHVAKRYLNDPEDDSSISADNVVEIYEDHEGTFWVGTGNGINILDRATDRFERIEHDPERPDRSLPRNAGIWQIKEDRQGQLWIATNSGLCRLERATRDITCYRNDPMNPASLSHDNVMDFWPAEDGTFWIATYGGGLNHFDPEPETFSHLTMRDGLPNDSLYSVLPDGEGYLWLSSNRGLTRFDPRTRQMRVYDAEDGLQSNEFNSRAFFASEDGELFFGGLEGFNVFRPDSVEESTYLPPVTLTSFKTLGRQGRYLSNLKDLEEVTVRHRDHVFSFEFAALDYTSPERNRYAYKLEGFDDDWIESGGRRFASYTNLDGGNYTFRVKGTNSDGVWNEEGASIRVVVIPPPWKTWWAYSLYLLAAVGAMLGYVRYQTLAQRREVERHRREAERLKAIDRMKDEFLANTSHELRTPLNGIIGISESLLDGAGGEITQGTRDNLVMVSASGRRLAHLVDDILDFSKLKNHEIVLRKRPVALRELVEVTLMLCRPLVGSRDLELVNDVATDLPPVEADEDRLQQILHNLLGNAIKFTRDGRVAVSAKLSGSEAESSPEIVKVSVTDTGVGIPADKLDRIFESFQQADASSAREFGGTGLGLTITRQLVKLHGGSMAVTSSEGEGSCFSFTLPVASGEAASDELSSTSTSSQKLSRVRDIEPAVSTLSAGLVSGSPASEASNSGGLVSISPASKTSDGGLTVGHGVNGHGMNGQSVNGHGHVLCVDDEPINLQVLENLLGLEGYSIQRANDGLECLEILKQGDLPDLILLDVMMPRMTGFEVARRIRQQFSAHRLPILLVTAKNQVSDLVEGLSSGANDYLSKPFSKQELLARVRTHLNLSRAHSVEAENQRKTEEMKQARKIQLSLLPKAPPEIPHLEIAAYLETATEVGGDYYDFFPQEDDALYVVTGDATGHGISAGMMVSMTKSALKALDVQSPHILLQQLNSVVRAVDLTRMQMALNVAYITQDEVAISSAAMPPAFLYRAGRQVAEEVLVPGLPLGALPGIEYELRVFDLLPGDALVLLSDGLPELLERRGEVDGYAAVGRTVEQHGAGSAQELLDALVALGEGGGNGAPEVADLLDDITMVVVKKR